MGIAHITGSFSSQFSIEQQDSSKTWFEGHLGHSISSTQSCLKSSQNCPFGQTHISGHDSPGRRSTHKTGISLKQPVVEQHASCFTWFPGHFSGAGIMLPSPFLHSSSEIHIPSRSFKIKPGSHYPLYFNNINSNVPHTEAHRQSYKCPHLQLRRLSGRLNHIPSNLH